MILIFIFLLHLVNQLESSINCKQAVVCDVKYNNENADENLNIVTKPVNVSCESCAYFHCSILNASYTGLGCPDDVKKICDLSSKNLKKIETAKLLSSVKIQEEDFYFYSCDEEDCLGKVVGSFIIYTEAFAAP